MGGKKGGHGKQKSDSGKGAKRNGGKAAKLTVTPAAGVDLPPVEFLRGDDEGCEATTDGKAGDAAPFKPLGRTLPFTGPEAIDTAALEVFDYQFPGREIDIVTTTEEFTSVCPFSGLPDYGQVTITYTPGRKCVELRSLKYYLMSFRNVGIFYEHLANRILEDLVRLLEPSRLMVECRFTPRGGLQTTVRAEYRH